MERSSWLLFLRGARTGSPRRRFARMPPAKMTSMEDAQRARGCFLEKGREPGVQKNVVFVHLFWIKYKPFARSSRTARQQRAAWARSKYGYIFNLVTWLARSKNASGSMLIILIILGCCLKLQSSPPEMLNTKLIKEVAKYVWHQWNVTTTLSGFEYCQNLKMYMFETWQLTEGSRYLWIFPYMLHILCCHRDW